MKEKFYVTKGINEGLDMRLIFYIQTLIDTTGSRTRLSSGV